MLGGSVVRGAVLKCGWTLNLETPLRCLHAASTKNRLKQAQHKPGDRSQAQPTTSSERTKSIPLKSSERTPWRSFLMEFKQWMDECKRHLNVPGINEIAGQYLSPVDKLVANRIRSDVNRHTMHPAFLVMCNSSAGNESEGPIGNRKEKLRQANLKLREKSKDIIRDLKETKQQMRNRVDKMIMSENIWTVPNLLSVIRMGMAPVLGYMILNSQFGPAIGLLVVAGVTDLLDGWIARVVPGQSSVMGSFLDPMADKILVGVLFVSLTYMDLIPVSLTALIIARDAVLISAAFYIRYQSLEPPRTIARYFNVTQPTAQLAPTFVSKVNTGIQLGLIGATLLSTVVPYDVHSYLVGLWFCTAFTTIGSGLSYVFAKNTYTILKQPNSSHPEPPFDAEDSKKESDNGRKQKHPPPA